MGEGVESAGRLAGCAGGRKGVGALGDGGSVITTVVGGDVC